MLIATIDYTVYFALLCGVLLPINVTDLKQERAPTGKRFASDPSRSRCGIDWQRKR